MLVDSRKPLVISELQMTPSEMQFIQYLPISMSGSRSIHVPQNLEWMMDMINDVIINLTDEEILENYLYITTKTLYCTSGNLGNRNGWHIDGFQTNDVQYVWSSDAPTQFAIQEFDIRDECTLSMIDMNTQVKEECIWDSLPNTLYKIGTSNVHRVTTKEFEGMRTFARISMSKEKYNLAGNAHNYLIDYDWNMAARNLDRNHTSRCVDFEKDVV